MCRSLCPLVVACIVALASSAPEAQLPASTESMPNPRDAASAISWAEQATKAHVRKTQPRVEIYLQEFSESGTRGRMPLADWHFLGNVTFGERPRIDPVSPSKQTLKDRGSDARPSETQRVLDGVAELLFPGFERLGAGGYEFTFERRDVLGGITCFVYAVRPTSGEGFIGSAWVEPRGLHVVRFTGMNAKTSRLLTEYFRRRTQIRVDSWRENVAPDVWVPTVAYLEEAGPHVTPATRLIRGATTIFGYEPEKSADTFTEIRLDQIDTVSREALMPERSRERWRLEAERNILERLTAGRFIAPLGGVEPRLEAIVNHMVGSNKLRLNRDVRCRVLLVSTLEAFTVGHTIVVSKGLVDVVNGEATLAWVLSRQLAHIALDHELVETRYSFPELLRISDSELLDQLRFQHTPEEEDASDEKATALLRASRYQPRMSEAGLFLQIVNAQARSLRSLIQPYFGEGVADRTGVLRRSPMMRSMQVLDATRDQSPALMLGSRLVVHPWTGRISAPQSEEWTATTRRDGAPFSVGPLMPFLDYLAPGERTDITAPVPQDVNPAPVKEVRP